MCSLKDFPIKLQKSINYIIEKQGYLSYKVYTKHIPMNGDGFQSKLYEVDIIGEANDGVKETNLFVKQIKEGDEGSWLSVFKIYQTELFFYKELSKIYADLQKDASVPSHERYEMVESYEGSHIEAIIMENIVKQGYEKFQRMDVVSLEYAEISIRQLAKFHGLSFVLQKEQPEYYNENIKKIKNAYVFEAKWKVFAKNVINFTLRYVNEDIKNRVESLCNQLADKYTSYFDNEALNICLCHGDYRPNNTLTKRNNGVLADLIPVDYQFMHYGCPALDLIYYIYISTDRKLRRAYMSHLKEVYHNALKTYLEHFNIDVELVYPRKKFDDDYKEMLDYGLLISFVWLPFVLVTEENIPNVNEESFEFNLKISHLYAGRQRDVIEEFIEWGYM